MRTVLTFKAENGNWKLFFDCVEKNGKIFFQDDKGEKFQGIKIGEKYLVCPIYYNENIKRLKIRIYTLKEEYLKNEIFISCNNENDNLIINIKNIAKNIAIFHITNFQIQGEKYIDYSINESNLLELGNKEIYTVEHICLSSTEALQLGDGVTIFPQIRENNEKKEICLSYFNKKSQKRQKGQFRVMKSWLEGDKIYLELCYTGVIPEIVTVPEWHENEPVIMNTTYRIFRGACFIPKKIIPKIQNGTGTFFENTRNDSSLIIEVLPFNGTDQVSIDVSGPKIPLWLSFDGYTNDGSPVIMYGIPKFNPLDRAPDNTFGCFSNIRTITQKELKNGETTII